MEKVGVIATIGLMILFCGGTVYGDPANPSDLKKAIGEVIKKNPEIIMDAMKSLQEKAMEKEVEMQKKAHKESLEALKKNRDFLEKIDAPVLGKKDAKKKLFIVINPYCGHCKDMIEDLGNLVKNDESYGASIIFLVHGEGKPDYPATQALLAAEKNGKFAEFLKKMKDSFVPLDKDRLVANAESLGMNRAEFEKTMESEEIKKKINDMMKIVDDLKIMGTPTLIYKEAIVPGRPPSEKALKEVLTTIERGEMPSLFPEKNLKIEDKKQEAKAERM